MTRKVYKTVILITFFGIVSLQNYAQQTPASAKKTDSVARQNDQQEMRKLQQNMRELQRQISELRQKQMKEVYQKNAESMKIFKSEGLNNSHVLIMQLDSIKTKVQGLVSTKINGLTNLYSYNFSPDGFTYNNGFTSSGKQEKMIEKVKTFSKTYSVNKKDKLIIDNQYGKVTVNTWNKNEFKVDVEIKVGTTDEAETQKLLDGVDIVSTQNQDGISFKTNIPERQNNNGLFTARSSNGNRKISINYTVFMPVKNALDITNRFGAVVLPDLEGAVTIHNSYGNFTAKELSNAANNIRLQFGNASIGSLNGGDLNLQYGNLKIGTASNLNATLGFSPVNIDRLKSSAKIKVNYGGGLKIDNLDKNLKTLDIDANFSNVSLDLDGSENFLFDVSVKHNVFNYKGNTVKMLNQPDSVNVKNFNLTKVYKGYVGKSGSDNKVTIKSNYQRVSFN